MTAVLLEKGATPHPAPLSEDAMWAAVLARDPAAEGRFLYGVMTTGVYCRPTCPSRRPLRTNVLFFAAATAAEAAGLRACKRCQPNAAPLAERHAAAIAKACHLIAESEEPPALDTLARAVGLSRFHFHRLFRAVTGVTPKAYAEGHRAGRVVRELDEGASVTEAIYGAGFGSNGRFYATSTSRLGMRPSDYRKGGRGATIRFAVGETSLGAILVAATDKGVCAIQFGDDPDALVRGLQDRFPSAELMGGDGDFEALVARVVGMVEAPAAGADLPLDVKGTAFQERVWRALRDIPAGETASFADIAARIGRPKAVRAVAQACAANPTAVAIPCHRVVRSDGGLSGYRWGVERKAALLEREAQSSSA
ncbi:MAG TPA: bifunctional DNA-binding transcriptional regulator/O6-methylguanine-DNA methyltransferase Ada [Caulobacteraceae bacterium]|nr:bifunctional DNA-binding transcriptional regulator/O6-methylguanine-DNA methyltransferase Ada [Caulobacteraceae bacterium]